LPSLVGWHSLARAQSADESFFLAFLVALHVATAIALLIYFRRDWVEIITAFVRTLRTRQVQTSTERLAWLIVVATVPVGLIGLLLEHSLRTVFAKPAAAAVFLLLNGVILLGGERARRRASVGQLVPVPAGGIAPPGTPPRRLDTLEFKEAGVIGLAQTLALFAGISRSGITMVAGLVRGLDHEDAARLSFLLATPIIFAAGVYKLPELFGPLGDGIRGQALVGALVAGIAAYLSVRFLMRFFTTKTLWPFGLYCLVVGGLSIVRFI
jgi:undecaprenyl-diphosphatase